MNPPQLPISSCGEVTPCVHHQSVITNQDITLLPSIVQRNPTIIENGVNSTAYSSALTRLEPLDSHFRSIKPCL